VIPLAFFIAAQERPKLFDCLCLLPLEQVALGVHRQRDRLMPHERLDFFGARPRFDVPSAAGMLHGIPCSVNMLQTSRNRTLHIDKVHCPYCR
jgi:hypothetical protein